MFYLEDKLLQINLALSFSVNLQGIRTAAIYGNKPNKNSQEHPSKNFNTITMCQRLWNVVFDTFLLNNPPVNMTNVPI